MADSAVVPNQEAPAPHLLRETVVRPTSGWRSLNLGELLLYRDLLMFLVWRDLKVRYQQTILGSAWAIIQPLATMVVFTVVFGKLAKLPSDGVPYPLFSFTALVIWTYFSQAVTGAVNSLIGNTQLIEKVYFPRLILPIAAVVRGLADLAISFAFLIAMLAFYGVWPSWKVVFVIPFTLLAIIATVGVGAGFAAINVRFRDVRQMMPLLVQLWMFATPVAYPASMAPEKWRLLLGLNPMTGVVEGYRWAMLNTGPFPFDLVALSTASALVMLIIGLFVFRRIESSFADII
ncbi:MAG: phosphate ABC transporter permease [Phenylobacterium sp.]|uniref:ABC transporter permease n=1 Tax=Phenylobacterium sp. TaxID=1871053 RepID=UPI0025FA3A72|nr:ABC transporter permease [Phenylobacterium sp.]MBA4010565.1 phosphate ABC transporter permease [Phenylobacterium sp.]